METLQNTMDRIAALTHERQYLLNNYDEFDIFNSARRVRLVELDQTLAMLWDEERRNRAARRAR